MKIKKTIFLNLSGLRNSIFRMIFILMMISSANSAYANTQLGDSTNGSTSINMFVPTIAPEFTEELIGISVTQVFSNIQNKEYFTYGSGEEPLITEWTIFPGPNSTVTIPKVVSSLFGTDT